MAHVPAVEDEQMMQSAPKFLIERLHQLLLRFLWSLCLRYAYAVGNSEHVSVHGDVGSARCHRVNDVCGILPAAALFHNFLSGLGTPNRSQHSS